MKILILGAQGMLGTDMTQALKETDHECIAWGKEGCNITDKEECQKISQETPDAIINCAAYTNVDGAEEEQAEAAKLNTQGVQNIIDQINKIKETTPLLIHISTDYVFDGKKESYTEEDNRNPIGIYGKTKADAEEIIETSLTNYYIVRTAWLFGKQGKNFVKTITRLCQEKDEIKVVNDQTGSPTYTKDLAQAIIALINQNKPSGIYHLTNEGTCTWYEFATEIKNKQQLECTIHPCTSEEYPTKATRPKSSVLQNNKAHKLRMWQEALEAYLNE